MSLENCTLTEDQECPHADKSAERAVKKVFSILGVNVDDPEKVEEFRINLRFGANMRRAADKGIFTMIGVIVTAFVGAVIAGLVLVIRGH